MTEAQHQSTLFRWTQTVRKKYPELKLLHHIPNGGRRDKIEAVNLKRQGVKPGVPDLCLPVPKGPFAGLYIEMKAEGGRTSIEQDWWLDELAGHGYFTAVCYGWTEAAQVIEKYLGVGKDDQNPT